MSETTKRVWAAVTLMTAIWASPAWAAEHHAAAAHSSPSPGSPAHNAGNPSHPGNAPAPSPSAAPPVVAPTFAPPAPSIRSVAPPPTLSTPPANTAGFGHLVPSITNVTPNLASQLGNSVRIQTPEPVKVAPITVSPVTVPPIAPLRPNSTISTPGHGAGPANGSPRIGHSEKMNVPHQSQTQVGHRSVGPETPRPLEGHRGTAVNAVQDPPSLMNFPKETRLPDHKILSGNSNHTENAPPANRPEVSRQADATQNVQRPPIVDAAIHHPRSPVEKMTSEFRPPLSNSPHPEAKLPNHVTAGHAGAVAGTPAVFHDRSFGRDGVRHVATAAERIKPEHLARMVNAPVARKVDLKTQLQAQAHGDLARRFDLPAHLAHSGGWRNHFTGQISPLYVKQAFGGHYAGPGFYPGYCWFPRWSPWVNWCWNFAVLPYLDPRPDFCQPIAYAPCGAWSGWDYPDWANLPAASCGTWVDAPDVVVPTGIDVQLLAVRFVDPGHPEQRIGPRYRVWFRNNSSVAVEQAFDLTIFASNDQRPATGLPEAGVRVTGMDAGQIQVVDLRLPWAANVLGRDGKGREIPFRYLHIIADSGHALLDVDPTNNGGVVDRLETLPVDPTIFSVALDNAGSRIVDIAGEGFGPEAGEALIELDGQELSLEILGWCDLGVQVRLPSLVFSEATKAEIILIRGDKAASNLHPIRIPRDGPAEVVPHPVP